MNGSLHCNGSIGLGITTLPTGIRDLNVTEAGAHCLTDGREAALDADAVDLLAGAAVDGVDPEHGCDVPDVVEGDLGELAAPHHGDGDAEAESEELVETSLAAVEADVGELPHALQ